jgi:hypothetical protein
MRAFSEVLDLDSTILRRKHETLHLLDGTNAVDRVSVVGIYSGDRMGEYRKLGYEAYARLPHRAKVFSRTPQPRVFSSWRALGETPPWIQISADLAPSSVRTRSTPARACSSGPG